MKKIYPLVKQEFGWLFEPINDWLKQNDIELYAQFVTGVTAGKLFWPRSHIDDDAWYTILVCQDYGRGIIDGGDFFICLNWKHTQVQSWGHIAVQSNISSWNYRIQAT